MVRIIANHQILPDAKLTNASILVSTRINNHINFKIYVETL
jgi:hypothetical protein